MIWRDAKSNICTFSKSCYSSTISSTTFKSLFSALFENFTNSPNVNHFTLHDINTFLFDPSVKWSNQNGTFKKRCLSLLKIVTHSKQICKQQPKFTPWEDLSINPEMINVKFSHQQNQTNSIAVPKKILRQPKFVDTCIQKNLPPYNQMKNQLIFYEQLCLYITLCYLTTNNLLNFKILVYQIIRVKLIISNWWRDKIS